MLHYYAVKYLHEDGTKSHGYIETLSIFKDGEIIESNGQKILVEFEMKREDIKL